MINFNEHVMKGGSIGVIIFIVVFIIIICLGLVIYLFMFGPLKNIKITKIFSNFKCINNSQVETIYNNSYNWLSEKSSGVDRYNTFLFENNKGNELTNNMYDTTNNFINTFHLNKVIPKKLQDDSTGKLKKTYLQPFVDWINDPENQHMDGSLYYNGNEITGKFKTIYSQSVLACKK